ncbi:MAG: UDP-N-acetylmuramoyl-L-alanine--D-glutamate ligase [Gemmatimonadota bacterium]|nr:MAG: UDP-N-acetylmuramoyl-L-alanine--D-glutamate ligase [Gemmatimonadota bacterium]
MSRGASTLEGTQVAIVGLAASGYAAAELALNRGGTVYVSDLRTDAATSARGNDLRALGGRVELGEHSVAQIAASQTVVVSPGVPPDAPVLVELRRAGVRWISEPEFAFRFFDGALIAVTGTNGKTTTAMLTGHLLEEAGIDVAIGGNVGLGLAPPASALALRDPAPAWYVVEMSSFQLADIDTFRPDIGVVTNLAPDHLDRYESVAAYYGDKARMFDNADEASVWVLYGGDPTVDELAGNAPGRRHYFSARTSGFSGAYLKDGFLTLGIEGEAEVGVLGTDQLPMLGEHNVENALAAMLAAHLAGAGTSAITRGLKTAPALPHRMELVVEGRGLKWVNDSKATNVAAAASAIASLPGPLVVMLGGKDKGDDFGPLAQALQENVRAVVILGEAGDRMAAEIRDVAAETIVCESFEDAVAAAASAAQPGDTVLLSPACSSFDMFEDYEERGARFAELAKEFVHSAPGGEAH